MVQLTPQSSGQPSEPTSWQWGHSHKRVRWARSAESTAMATFQGGLSDPQGPSYSSGQQGGAHSLQRSERHRFVIRHQIYLNAYLWCHTQVIFFPTAHPVKLSSYPIVTPPILSPCLLHRREILLLLRQDCLNLETKNGMTLSYIFTAHFKLLSWKSKT
jgi:hypothetical protein